MPYFWRKCLLSRGVLRSRSLNCLIGKSRLLADNLLTHGEQGWRSGESTRLPPIWPGFDSRPRCHMWVEFVVGSRPCSEGLSGFSGFPPSTKTNISKFELESVDEKPLCGDATAKLQNIYLFIFCLPFCGEPV